MRRLILSFSRLLELHIQSLLLSEEFAVVLDVNAETVSTTTVNFAELLLSSIATAVSLLGFTFQDRAGSSSI